MSSFKCRTTHKQSELQTDRQTVRHGVIIAVVLILTTVRMWASSDRKSEWKQINGDDKGERGNSGTAVTFRECYNEWGASPDSLLLFASLLPLLFSSWSFVCLSYHDVTLNAPPLLNFNKVLSKVGQIWLNDIKFCSFFTWIKIKPEAVLEILSLLAVSMCKLPTHVGPTCFTHFCFSFFTVSVPR